MNARVFPRRTKFTPPKSDEYVQKLLEFRDRKIRTGERIMKTKHTPGPLAMGTDCDSKDLVITNENTIVASVYEKEYGPLFAAAPEMADALIECCEACEKTVCGGCSVGRALHKAGIILELWDGLAVDDE